MGSAAQQSGCGHAHTNLAGPSYRRHRGWRWGGWSPAASHATRRPEHSQRDGRQGSCAKRGRRLIFAIDAGNSRVKWGWHDGTAWNGLATVSLIEFAAANHDINPFAATHADPERIIISNVAGEAAHQLIVNWTSIFEAEAHWLHGEAERCGVKSRYDAPEQLGPDRWAALVAARS